MAREEILWRVRGVVQGVGFRPFVHRTASRLSLRGWVRNDPQGVLIRAEGEADSLGALQRALLESAPPAARVSSVEVVDGAEATLLRARLPVTDFAIVESGAGGATEASIPPDLALCPDCRREMADRGDRRHRYPLINCTQCGPRYSILEALPYDRANTTMRWFAMCERCRKEYDDPKGRRFHAEPIACPDCGPQIRLIAAGGEERGEPALAGAAAVLAAGGILAVKGVGGYHLMADAGSAAAVAALRRRKRRDEKPFAVMFADLAAAAAAVEFTAEEAALLSSPAAPIVLLRRRAGAPLAPGVAPGNPWVGAFLAYAPLQVLLLQAFPRPLVATSANLAEEPLCANEGEAEARLAGIANAFLHHNRPIAHPVDDSVLRPLASGGSVVLRRARGLAPASFELPGRIEGCWLCAGGQMKNTLAIATNRRLVLGPHIGDLGGTATREVFRRTAEVLRGIYGQAFTAVACDRHPDYASTRFAEASGLPRIAVQHHLAHVLSCLLENGQPADEVLGVAWDGTGLGEDGTIWGGEFILLRRGVARRFARLRPFRLPGGEAAIRDGRRTVLGLAQAAGGDDFGRLARALHFLAGEAAVIATALERGLNAPLTSSMGRLFDAAGVLLGLGDQNRFEGQIPLALEAAAVTGGASGGRLAFPLRALAAGAGASWELDWEPAFRALTAIRQGEAAAPAAAWHRGLAAAIVEVARAAGARSVALSGGCFQNAHLLELAVSALRHEGFSVWTHRQIPPNDGGIAAGQALAALWGLTEVQLP